MFNYPRLCSCGRIIPPHQRCVCQVERSRERRARHDRNRPTARQRGYTAEWEKARKLFLDTHPACIRCGAPATTVDHRIPHRGDHYLFWERSNWQPLCTRCHSKHKQREEHGKGAPHE